MKGIIITVTSQSSADLMESLIVGMNIAKALSVESIQVDFYNGIQITCRKDSNLNDLMEIYQLKTKAIKSRV